MAETWHEEAGTTIIAAALAGEGLPKHELAELETKLRPALARISTHYPAAKAGNDDARYAILDACDDVSTILDATTGDFQPKPGTIAYKLKQRQGQG